MYCPLALIKYFEGSVQLQLKSIAITLEPQGTAAHGVSEPGAAAEKGVGGIGDSKRARHVGELCTPDVPLKRLKPIK